MEKILLGIHVPAINACYDAFVPADVPVSELCVIIAEGIAELSNEKYRTSRQEMLTMKEPEGVLDPVLTLQAYNIKDGMQLYLI